jgi:16S rRNA (uracil1498-N3)-methyltransferase
MPPAEIAQRLFVEADLEAGAVLTLGEAQAHYLVNVMRLKAGDIIAVFNGRDGEWCATIAETAKKRCTLRLEGRLRPQAREPDVWLVFAPLKKVRIDLVA